jgi:hypothetical protein
MEQESTVGQYPAFANNASVASARFYSKTVTAGQLGGSDQEIAVLRVKNNDIPAASSQNAINTLTRLTSLNEGAYFHRFRACSYLRGRF